MEYKNLRSIARNKRIKLNVLHADDETEHVYDWIDDEQEEI